MAILRVGNISRDMARAISWDKANNNEWVIIEHNNSVTVYTKIGAVVAELKFADPLTATMVIDHLYKSFGP